VSAVLLLEKGKRLPMDGSTLDVRKVVHDGRFKSREVWRRRARTRAGAEEYFNLGGNDEVGTAPRCSVSAATNSPRTRSTRLSAGRSRTTITRRTTNAPNDGST
jgi:hypothetical protein